MRQGAAAAVCGRGGTATEKLGGRQGCGAGAGLAADLALHRRDAAACPPSQEVQARAERRTAPQSLLCGHQLPLAQREALGAHAPQHGEWAGGHTASCPLLLLLLLLLLRVWLRLQGHSVCTPHPARLPLQPPPCPLPHPWPMPSPYRLTCVRARLRAVRRGRRWQQASAGAAPTHITAAATATTSRCPRTQRRRPPDALPSAAPARCCCCCCCCGRQVRHLSTRPGHRQCFRVRLGLRLGGACANAEGGRHRPRVAGAVCEQAAAAVEGAGLGVHGERAWCVGERRQRGLRVEQKGMRCHV